METGEISKISSSSFQPNLLQQKSQAFICHENKKYFIHMHGTLQVDLIWVGSYIRSLVKHRDDINNKNEDLLHSIATIIGSGIENKHMSHYRSNI